MSDLTSKSACELRDMFVCADVSARQIVESHLEQTRRVNPDLNGLVCILEDEALAQADALDARRKAGDRLGPLAGVPVAIKDLNDIAGVPTTYGSPLFQNNVPARDDDVVANLRARDAIIFGKSNVPEHGFGATTTNPVFGESRNPHAPGLSAGASTGGGAVAVAANMTPLATGSDFAGSLRTPPAFCGISGIRPSNGIVGTRRRPLAWSPFDVEGPLARTAQDCKLLLSAMARQDAGDPLSAPGDAALGRPARFVNLGGLRVAISEDLGFAPVAREMRATFRRKLTAFADAFGAVRSAHPDLGEAERTFTALRGVGFVADFGPMEREFGERLGPVVLDELARARQLTVEEIGAAHQSHTRAFVAAADFFSEHDILITPAASVPPFPHDDVYPAEIDGEPMGGYLRWEAIAWGITLTQCPAAVIPCGRDAAGLPFGLQIVAGYRRDGWLLDVAHTLERLFAGDPDLARPRPDLSTPASRT